MDVIDYMAQDDYKTRYTAQLNATNELVSCQYFQTNLLRFNQPVEKDFYSLDSFVIYMCMDGSASIDFGGSYEEQITKGETVLIPAALHSVKLTPRGEASLLEVYIP